ncbi:MAG TPA: O-antigen ligase family protein [Microbacteriaceae bacterium]|nr:O-antigen ligase family protein [Microbacteriaceae bacterium]
MSFPSVASSVRSRFWLRTWATATLFLAFAGQFVRNAFGYWVYSGIAIAGVLIAVAVWIAVRPEWKWRRIPKTLVAFLLLTTASLSWSAYPEGSSIGATTQLMSGVAGLALGLTLSWAEWVRTLSVALRWILGLSLAFEAWVAFVLQQPLLPNYLSADGPVPKAFYWSRNLLLHGGPLDGIVGNRNLLGFIALLAAIVFAVQLGMRTVRRGWGIAWLAFAVVMLGLTRSATVLVVAALVVLAALFALWMRSREPGRRTPVYAIGLLGAAGLAVGTVALRGVLLSGLGRSEDLTGRFDIWATVSGMFAERPLAGWGWIGYWLPWVPPFGSLAKIDGVVYLQAHNAWLDIAMQLGILGLIVFGAFVAVTLWRSWVLAVDRPLRDLNPRPAYQASALLPWLLMIALLGQSLTESRLLYEGNFILLVMIAVLSKQQQWRNAELP